MKYPTGNSEDVYCPKCDGMHYGWGAGVAHPGGTAKCPMLFSKSPEAFYPSKEAYESDKSIIECKWCLPPYPSYPSCKCTIQCGWKNCVGKASTLDIPVKDSWKANVTPTALTANGLKTLFEPIFKHEIASASSSELEWLNLNAQSIASGATSCYDFWQGLFKHIWCGRDNWEGEDWTSYQESEDKFLKWNYYDKYITKYYEALQKHLRGIEGISMATPIIMPGSASRPRTQKGKGLQGIAKLNDALHSTLHYQFQSKSHVLCKVERVLEPDNIVALSRELLEAWRSLTSSGKRPLFARPCPYKPRHGFVDSRVLELPVNSTNWREFYGLIAVSIPDEEYKSSPHYGPEKFTQLEALVKPLKDLALEVQSHDKKGEIVLMPFVEASMGAIYANGAITIGLGNEGATSGDNALVLPCANVWPETIDAAFWSRFGIANSPFLELVYEPTVIARDDDEDNSVEVIDPIKANPILVQLRDGPKMDLQACNGDYIPFKLEVDHEKLISVSAFEREKNALIAFEKFIEKAPAGTVVLHPNGAISSHYGIHCVMHKVAYITSKGLCAWLDAWRRVKEGRCIVSGLTGATTTTTATFTLEPSTDIASHNGSPDRATWLKGYNAGLLMESLPYADSMIQASLYFLHSSSAIDFSEPTISYAFGFALAQTLKLGMLALIGEARHRTINLSTRSTTSLSCEVMDREAIYKVADSIPPELLALHALEIGKAFSFTGWSSGVGGYNWHLCAIEVTRTWNACVDFIGGGDFIPVLAGLNNVIHASHNGAKMLTKFSSIATMDLAVKCPPVMALITAPILWYLTHNQPSDGRAIDIRKGPSAKDVEEALITDMTCRAFAEITMEKVA